MYASLAITRLTIFLQIQNKRYTFPVSKYVFRKGEQSYTSLHFIGTIVTNIGVVVMNNIRLCYHSTGSI